MALHRCVMALRRDVMLLRGDVTPLRRLVIALRRGVMALRRAVKALRGGRILLLQGVGGGRKMRANLTTLFSFSQKERQHG